MKKISSLRFLLNYISKAKKHIASGIFFTIFMSISELFPGVVFKVITDSLGNISENSEHLTLKIKLPLKAFNTKVKLLKTTLSGKEEIFTAFIYLSLTLLIIYIIINLFWYFRDVFFNSAVEKIVYHFKKDIYSKIVWLETKEFKRNKTGDLISRVTYDVSVINQIIEIFVELTRSGISLIIFLPVLIYIDYEITFFALLFYPISYLFIKSYSGKLKSVSKNITENVATYTDFLEEKINRFETIKLNQQEKEEEDKFHKLVYQNYCLNLNRIRVRFFLKPATEIIGFAGIAVICIYFGFILLYGKMNPGTVVFYLITLKAAYKPFKKVAKAIGDVHISLVSVEKIKNLLHLKSEDSQLQSNNEDFVLQKIIINNVHFKYEKMSEDLFTNLNLQFKKNKIYGITGYSGSGKSTLVSMISGLIYPNKGSIDFLNEDNKLLSKINIKSRTVLINKNYKPFNVSFEKNILYGRESEKIEKNSETDLLAQEFFDFRKISYKSIIGKDGLHLSDGQNIKLQLLNGFIKKPEIIILDEVLEQLDKHDVKLIFEKIEKIDFVIIISRNKEFLERADCIYTLS